MAECARFVHYFKTELYVSLRGKTEQSFSAIAYGSKRPGAALRPALFALISLTS